MKKLISIGLISVMLMTLLAVFPVSASDFTSEAWDGSIGTAFDGGSGTVDDPYLISSGKTFAYLEWLVNTATSDDDEKAGFQDGKFFKLTQSIDLANKPWTPIGKASGVKTFNGTLDGAGYTIKNLNAVAAAGGNCSGLFGYVAAGCIKNLGIESGIVNVTTQFGGSLAALLQENSANQTGGSIINCYNNATVKAVNRSGSQTFMGGIVGATLGTYARITDCVNYGTVDLTTSSTNASSGYGGIAGFLSAITVENCYNVGVMATKSNFTGGLFGAINAATIVKNCASSALIYGNGFDGWAVAVGTAGTTYENVKVYTSAYAQYTDGKITVDGTEYILASRLTGNANTVNNVSVTVDSTSEFKLGCAPGEKFIKATEFGKYLTSSVGNGSVEDIDGVLDEAYLSSFRIEDYGTGTNVLNDTAWTDMKADVYVMADSSKIYAFISVTDTDVVDGDAADVWLSLDGENIIGISITSAGSLTCTDSTLQSNITSETLINDNGWTAEIAIPVSIVSKDEIGLGFGLTDKSSSASARFSELEWGKASAYTVRDIHGDVGVAVTGITLDNTTLSPHTGESKKLQANVAPNNAYELGVEWSSSDTSVVSVSRDGVVKASRAGSATITATTVDGGFTATCEVTVLANSVTGITLDYTELTLQGGKKKMLTCTVAPENADNKSVTWSSSDEKVATVSANGLVTAVSGGTATITATSADGGYTASCKVTVVVPLLNLSFTNDVLDMTVGETKKAPLSLDPADATADGLTWTSSDTSIVTVSESGKITAVAAGSATVTVTDGTLSATLTVNVSEPTEDANPTDSDKAEGGCGSIVGGTGIIVFALAATVGAVITGKKEEN